MKPVAALPIHDPDGIMFPQLERITPFLKQLFAEVFIGVSVATQQLYPEKVAWLEADSFFRVVRHQSADIVGEDFIDLYYCAASSCKPTQVVHLCFTDRVAYAFGSEHQVFFMTDIQNVTSNDTPLIFQRSELAWQTHPDNYRAIERMATTVGELLFEKSLDFAWCHIAIQAGRLLEIVPTIRVEDGSMGFFAGIVLAIRDEVRTREVDWLSWEDPFVMGRDEGELKRAREASVEETRKRLSYVVPMLELLVEASEGD